VYRIVDMQFRLVGPNPAHKDVTRVCRRLRAWWATVVGKPIRTGRPEGTGYFPNAQEFHDALRAARATLKRENIRPTPAHIADKLLIAERTYYDYLASFGPPD
jgi:hypothetical protein